MNERRAYAAPLQALYDHIAANLPIAKSVIRNLVKITSNWNLKNAFTPAEIKWLLSMPIPKATGTIYRAMSIKKSSIHKFVRGKKIRYRPQYQVSSWATSKSGLEYFHRGGGFPVTLSAPLPRKHFHVQGFFKLVNQLHLKLSEAAESRKGLDSIGRKVYDLLDSIQLYNENEVLVFGPIVCEVLRVSDAD